MTESGQAALHNVAVRDAMISVQGAQNFFTALREVGLSSFELGLDPTCNPLTIQDENGAEPFSLADEISTARFQARLDEEGVSVCAVLLGTDFSGPNAEAHVQWAVRAVHAAGQLGAPAVRLDPLTSNRDLSMPQIRDNFVRCVGQVLEQTQNSGVDLGIENHGAVGNNPEFLDGIFERVDNPRLGMTLDSGNFYWSGLPLQELYGVIEHFAPRAKHTHIKSIAYPDDIRETRRAIGFEYGRYCAPIHQGDLDIARIVRTLRDAGYKRALCIENESLAKFPQEKRNAVLSDEVSLLREVDRR